jgi:hypothetical protein
MILCGSLLAGSVHSGASAGTAMSSPLPSPQLAKISSHSYGEKHADADCAKGHAEMTIDAALAQQIDANRGSDRKFPVIITLQQPGDLSVLRQHGVEPTLVYQNMPGLAASLTADQIAAVGNLPEVRLIELDQPAWALERH